MTPSERAKATAGGRPFLKKVMQDNGWWFAPKFQRLEGPMKRKAPQQREPPKQWQGWEWLREEEPVPGFIRWEHRGLWLFGQDVRIEFFTQRPGVTQDIHDGYRLSERDENHCIEYSQGLLGRDDRHIYGLLAIGEWSGQAYRVWERRDEVVSLTRALPHLVSHPSLILRVCRDLVEICRSLPPSLGLFPYAGLSWFVLEKDRVSLARLPYRYEGTEARPDYAGQRLFAFVDLSSRGERLLSMRARDKVHDPDTDIQDYFGRALYILLSQLHAPDGGLAVFDYSASTPRGSNRPSARGRWLTSRRELFTPDRHAHLFAGSPGLRKVILRMIGLSAAGRYLNLDLALNDLSARLEDDI